MRAILTLCLLSLVSIGCSKGSSGGQQARKPGPISSRQTEYQRLNCPLPLAGKSWCTEYKYQDGTRSERLTLGLDCKFTYGTTTIKPWNRYSYGASGEWQLFRGEIFVRGDSVNIKHRITIAKDKKSFSIPGFTYSLCGN